MYLLTLSGNFCQCLLQDSSICAYSALLLFLCLQLEVLITKCSMLKRCSFATWLLILLCCGVGNAADFDLEVNVSGSYDSNVYRSAIDTENDVYFTLSPRAALELPFNKAYFSSDVRASLEQHVNISDANLQELAFSGIGRYSPSDYVSFGLEDRIVISDRLQAVEKLSDIINYREFVDNRFLSAIKYELKAGILTVSMRYANVVRNYIDAEVDDWVTHSGQLQTEYFIGHRTSALVDVGLIKKLYEIDVDYISVPVTASLKRKLSNKFEAALSMGFEGRRYNEIIQDRDWNKPTVSLDITGDLGPKIRSRLLLRRRVYDSDVETGYAFVSTAPDFMLTLSLNDAARLTLQGIYSRNSYIQVDRTDDVLGGRGSIRYALSRWGAVILGYGYERRNSSVLNNDYQQHKMELSYVALF